MFSDNTSYPIWYGKETASEWLCFNVLQIIFKISKYLDPAEHGFSCKTLIPGLKGHKSAYMILERPQGGFVVDPAFLIHQVMYPADRQQSRVDHRLHVQEYTR